MLEGLLGLLVFAATLLALIVGVVLMALALITRRFRRAGQVALALCAWLGLYAAALLTVSVASQPRFLPLGEERCFDEMCYSVQAVTTAHTLNAAPAALTAQGEFWIVTVQLRSAARGTAQKPSEPDLFILDGTRRRYPQGLNAGEELNLPIGTPVTGRQLWNEPVPAGGSLRRTVAFDLPVGIQHPALAISEGLGAVSVLIIGDEGSFLHAKTEFLLEK